MCDSLYHLYWWEIEPYLEIAEVDENPEESLSRFGLKGMMFDAVNELLLVLVLALLSLNICSHTSTSM